MNPVEYVKLNEIQPAEFLTLLNKQSTREHLIVHELFDLNKVELWIKEKVDVDSTQGCRVRAITVDKQLAGWCGIQLEEGKYEIAVVIDDQYWGLGKKIFREIMCWAKELGHATIFIHLFHTRPEYKFLSKLSKNVYESELLGSRFTTYELEVS
ncbi:MAG: GNAT family N-acetyltransferase [Motiliproteus sp.]